MVKKCTVCKVEKSLELFYIKNKVKNKYHSQCKACYAVKRKFFYEAHYAKYGDAYRKRARIRKANTKMDRQEKVAEFMAGKSCEHCGIDDIRVLEFDHLDPSTKSFTVAQGINESYSWERIQEEIKKCRILCANCHRIWTGEQQNWRKWRLGRVVRQDSAKVRTPVQIR